MIKNQTIGELLDEARQSSGAATMTGHDIMGMERFYPDTTHMIIFDVLTNDSPIGWKGEKTRVFMNDFGYGRALEHQKNGHIYIRNHAKVNGGHLYYDHNDREL